MQKEPCSFKYLPHFGFTGAFRSTTTGLTHLGARWSSARLGQFISPDPLWYIDSFDLYAYAGFDPINKWDPTGMASKGLASTEQNDRELGTSWGLGTRSQASSAQEPALFYGNPGNDHFPHNINRRPYFGRTGGNISNAGFPNRMLGDSGTVPLPPGHEHDLNRKSRATVTRHGNTIQMKLRLYYKGHYNEEELREWHTAIEQAWSGQFGRFDVTTQVEYTLWQPLRFWRWNTIHVWAPQSNNTDIRRHQNPSVSNGIRGDWYAGMRRVTAAHEAGHLLGVGDRRVGVEPWPGWEGNLMMRSYRQYSHPAMGPSVRLRTINGHTFTIFNRVWEEDILDILSTHHLLEPGER